MQIRRPQQNNHAPAATPQPSLRGSGAAAARLGGAAPSSPPAPAPRSFPHNDATAAPAPRLSPASPASDNAPASHLSALTGWARPAAATTPTVGAPAAPTRAAEATAPNPIDQIPTRMLPEGNSSFDFKARLGRLAVASGDGDIERKDGRISITARPRGEEERRSTLEPDPDKPGNVLMTRHDGSRFSGRMKVSDEGGIHFSDGKGHSLSMDPNSQGGFDMTTTGFGIESRVTTVVSHVRPRKDEP